jgi:hypothetical protein
VQLAIGGESRGDCAPVPLRAIVLLEPSSNGTALNAVDPFAAVRDLFALSFRLPQDADRARAFAGVADVVRSVRLWRLRYRHRLDALDDAVDAVVTGV